MPLLNDSQATKVLKGSMFTIVRFFTPSPSYRTYSPYDNILMALKFKLFHFWRSDSLEKYIAQALATIF